MGPHLIVMAPLFDADLRFEPVVEPVEGQDSSRNLPLNDSFVAFCHGLPGSMSAVSIAVSRSHRRIVAAHEFGAVVEQVPRVAVDADANRSTPLNQRSTAGDRARRGR
jgi:hypothetical protein